MDFEADIKACTHILTTGGTILYPTDTVWGIGCNALDETAIDRVFKIKERPGDKSLIVLLADARDIIQYVAAPHPDIIDIVERFDCPTTVVYDGALDFPLCAVHPDGSIAIRVTKDPFCKALIKRAQTPLISTSANKSGAPTPAMFSEIDEAIKTGVDYIVKYRQEDQSLRPPSRIVRIGDDGGQIIIRA